MSESAATKTPTLDELEALKQVHVAAKAEVRAIGLQTQNAQRAVADATEDLVRAFDAGDQAAAKKAEAARNEAQAVADEPWSERIKGAERTAERALGDVEHYQRENVGRLMAELRPLAIEAAAAVDAAIEQFETAVLAWSAAANRANRINVAAGRPNDRAPLTDGLTNLVIDIKRRGATPLPLPSRPQTVGLHPDPDHSAARFVGGAL